MLKKMLAALVVVAAFAVTAIAGEGPFTIGFSEHTLGVSWRVQSNEEFRYAAQQNPDVKNFIVTQANGDVSKQIADIEDLISQKVDAILINAGSPKALIPVINKAAAAGIVVVDFDNTTESDKAYHLTIDQEEFGRLGAEFLVKALDGKGKIVCFNGVKGTGVSAGRYAGAEKVFQEYPDIEILATVFGGWDYATAKKAMESLFAAYPTIDGIWSQGGAMSEAIMDAYFERGQMPPPITGEDNNGFFRAWSKAKEMDPNFDSISASCPTWISAEAMRLAIKVLKGEEVQRTTFIPVPTITKDNMLEYYKPDLPSSYYCNTQLPDDIVKKLFDR